MYASRCRVSRRARAGALTAALSLAVSTACGSTAQHTLTIGEDASGLDRLDGDLSMPEPGVDSDRGGTARDTADHPRGTESSTAAEGQGPAVRQNPATGNHQGATASPSNRSGPSGRGFTENKIYIGYSTINDSSEFASSVGVDVNFGDTRAVAKAVVEDINKKGGIAGRKVELVFHDVKTNESPRSSAQSMCARWTEDRPVFGAVNMISAIDDATLTACMARRQTPLVDPSVIVRPQSIYSRYKPYQYALAAPSMERLIRRWMQRLASLDYFSRWDHVRGAPGNMPTKVGILSHRGNYAPDFTRIVRQELGRQSQPVGAKFEHSGNFANIANEMNQAVIEFREAGVTHVVASLNLLLFFMTSADAQNYFPRYAINTDNSPEILQRTAPERQLAGALGVGYRPTRDVDNVRNPGDVSSAETRCRKLMKEAGQDTSRREAYMMMLQTCDAFNFLTTAIKKGDLSPQGLQRGGHEMGSMSPSSTFGISLKGGRFDGASAVRDLEYRKSCPQSSRGCFAYKSTTNRSM